MPHLAEYDPPGYLYQPADLNGHVLEYTTLAAGGGLVNGGVHGGYGGQMLPQGCHHLHHKLPNGLALLNGSGGFMSPSQPHGHEGTLPHSARECEHPHHHLNVSPLMQTTDLYPVCVVIFLNHTFVLSCKGGNVYTALPQKEASDCMSCQNLCNNNRFVNMFII